MKKLLFLLMAATLTLSSCIKEDESYKKTIPVQPGIRIRNYVSAQNYISMQPINMAIRLAILAAEAEKQHKEGEPELDLTKVMVKNVNIFNELFPSKTTLTKLDNGDYQLTFKVETVTAAYPCEGTMTVRRNGVPQLYDTTGEAGWTVQLGDDFSVLMSGTNGYQRVFLSSGQFGLYYNGSGSYALDIKGVQAYYEKSEIKSAWSGEFELTPDADGVKLAASDCMGKVFEYTGSASGPSCYTFNGKEPVSMSYDIEKLTYVQFASIRTGEETCALVGEYDTSLFPAPNVEVEWLYSGGRSSQIVQYNGSTVTLP